MTRAGAGHYVLSGRVLRLAGIIPQNPSHGAEHGHNYSEEDREKWWSEQNKELEDNHSSHVVLNTYNN